MLKSIEISGFKSFADKTVLDFPAGITAVVGPNGSGKSNIVDAIRWVLGEQSTKHIRISGGADVIFSGTVARQPSAFASITAHFDNSRGVFPIEYSELSVSRKIYRDGNSEYSLNKKQVRLKDIVQLLAGAKLGLKGMSIINQGAADVFLRATPPERREMIEEMVGLKEYRMKKEEAERKIKEAKDNLCRVQTLISEMEPNLHSLKRQVSRWQSRAAKESELKACEETYFLGKFHELEHLTGAAAGGAPRDLRSRRAALEKDIAALTEQANALDARDPALTPQEEALSRSVQNLRDAKTEIARRLGNTEGQIEALARAREKQELVPFMPVRRAIEAIIERLGRAAREDALELVKVAIKEALGALQDIVKKGTGAAGDTPDEQELIASRARDSAELKRVSAELADYERKLRQMQASAAQSTEELRKAYKALEDKRIALREIDAGLEQERFMEEKRKIKEEDLRVRLQEAGWEYPDAARRYAQAVKSGAYAPLAEEATRDLEMKMIRLRRDLGAIGEIDATIVTEYEEINTRHEFLVNQERDVSAALKDWEAMNQSLEKTISEGFHAALLKIDKEFDRYFGLIFEGGKASLRMVRPEPLAPARQESEGDSEGGDAAPANPPLLSGGPDAGMAEPGIEFSVHLPRKKIRSLDMLSGGEKALTAIALLFAIVAYAQPPFLVFDEIDAALDERNSGKVATLLKDLAAKVQFILITHNRSVMEAAEVLYGITMDDGVSRVFSLRFAEAEEIARQDVHAPEPGASA